MKESPRHKGLRNQLVLELKAQGISDQRVLDALNKVPRHLFLNSAFLEKAYENIALQIDEDQTISQPYTVAFMSEMLKTMPGEKVLEIGTGSGYQACILYEMGLEVFTIERIKKLYLKTSRFIRSIGYPRINTIYGDGYEGHLEKAPYDKIIITAATEKLPEKLVRQLKIGGLMIFPQGTTTQKMMLLERTGENDASIKELGDFKFVPMLAGTQGNSRYKAGKLRKD